MIARTGHDLSPVDEHERRAAQEPPEQTPPATGPEYDATAFRREGQATHPEGEDQA